MSESNRTSSSFNHWYFRISSEEFLLCGTCQWGPWLVMRFDQTTGDSKCSLPGKSAVLAPFCTFYHSTHALTMNMVKKIPPQFSQWNPLEKPICLNMPLVLKIFLAAFWKIQIFVPNIFRFKTQIQTTFVLFNIFSKKAHEIFLKSMTPSYCKSIPICSNAKTWYWYIYNIHRVNIDNIWLEDILLYPSLRHYCSIPNHLQSWNVQNSNFWSVWATEMAKNKNL